MKPHITNDSCYHDHVIVLHLTFIINTDGRSRYNILCSVPVSAITLRGGVCVPVVVRACLSSELTYCFLMMALCTVCGNVLM